ncbi:hypothetical protein N9L24_03440 [Candidatus Marinamargulisbacteria bacterium]|nr:hypothetical protein [Candidatus Marinamargulisbacteria bacterium]
MQGRVTSHPFQSIENYSTWFSANAPTQAAILVRPSHTQMANRLITSSSLIEQAARIAKGLNGADFVDLDLSLDTIMQHIDRAMSQTVDAAPEPLPIPTLIRSEIAVWADAKNQSLDDVLPSVTQFYHQLPPAVQDPILMALLRADLQRDDSLMSFLDHEIAIRGSLTNDDPVYLPNIDDIMADHHAFFDIVALDPLDALSSNDERESNRKQTYKQQQCLNAIDFILFELLLEEQLPLGLIRFRLIPNLQKSNKTDCVLDLTLYQNQSMITALEIRYVNQTDIWVTRGNAPFAHLNLNLKSGRVYRINGHIQNKAFLCHYSRSDTSRLKLSISQWRTTLKFSQANRDLTGTWKKPNGDQKCFQLRGKRRKIGGNAHHSYRAQLGEDAIQAVYQFPKTGKRTSPIPLAGTGAILNNAFTPHTAIVVPYPTWTLGL